MTIRAVQKASLGAKKSEEAAASPKDFKVRVCSLYFFGSLAASPQGRGLDKLEYLEYSTEEESK